MKRILVYTPFNSRSRDTESVMQHFVKKGHEVFLLTQEEWGPYHDAAQLNGIKCSSHLIERRGSISYFIKHTLFLIRFARKNKIDVIFAHLENAGLPAVLAHYFIKSTVVVCRHIVDEAYLFNSKNFILQNKIVYRLAKKVIVVSARSKRFMVEKEKIDSSKIDVINLAYNFELYPKTDADKISLIKNQFNSSFLMLSICRLVESKRPDHSIQLAKRLSKTYPDIKLLILGSGPMEKSLNELIAREGLQKTVFLLGHVSDPLNYISACDMLIHPSLLDSSSVTIKEAGLLKKPFIACSEIGDLDDYVTNYESGLLVDKDNFIAESEKAIHQIIKGEINTHNWGENLNRIVMERFSIKSVGDQYNKYLK